jgi:hypothetical protein
MGKSVLTKLPLQNLMVLVLCLGIVPSFIIYAAETKGFVKGTLPTLTFFNCSSPANAWRMVWLAAYTFVLLTSCRFLCRAMLAGMRTRPGYGYRLQAATAGLVCLTVAGHAMGPTTGVGHVSLGTRGIHLALWSLAGVLLLLLTFPWWLKKTPKPIPDPVEATWVWPCLLALAAVQGFAHRDWLAGSLSAGAVLAIMGIRHLVRRSESPAGPALSEPPANRPPLPRAG